MLYTKTQVHKHILRGRIAGLLAVSAVSILAVSFPACLHCYIPTCRWWELQLFCIPANTFAFLSFSHSGEREGRSHCDLVCTCLMNNEVMVTFLYLWDIWNMVRRVCWEPFICFLTELAVFPALIWQSSAHVLHINTWAEAFNLFGTNMKCIYTWKTPRTVYNYSAVQKKER